VDAVSRKEFWEMLRRLKEQGITILVSTPYMDEASLCDRVALIQKGKIMSIDTPQAVVNAFPYPLLAVKSEHMLPLLHQLLSHESVKDAYVFGEHHHVVMHKNADISFLENYLMQNNHSVEIKKAQPNIEDCFMLLMKDGEENGL